MNTLWLRALERWKKFSNNEQLILLLLSSFIGLLLIYFVLLQPVYQAVNTQYQQWQNNQALLTWMQPRVERLMALPKSSTSKIKDQDLLSLLQGQMKQQTALQSYLVMISQNNAGGVDLEFKGVPFSTLMGWLKQLWKQGIEISQMDASQEDTKGTVDIRITLRVRS